jgi:hypothetical protein
MNIRTSPSLYAALIREVDDRMTQALDNFFQRSRTAILDDIAHAISRELTPAAAMLAAGQTCMDWLNAQPDQMSAAFAAQFEPHRDPSGSRPAEPQASNLQLLDDDQFDRQLAEDKAVTFLTEMLGPDAHTFFNRLATLYSQDASPANPALAYGPRTVVRALSTALDALALDTASGTLLLRHAAPALKDTLRHTYAALNQYLVSQDIETQASPKPVSAPARTPRPDNAPLSAGDAILAHIRSAGAALASPLPVPAPAMGAPAPALCPALPRGGPRQNFADSLGRWQAGLPRMTEIAPDAPILVLRQLQAQAGETDADGFDLAMLDAVAGLFECILADPDVAAGYKSEIAQLQIPTLRAALAAPVFFSDDSHPARQLIDLLGRFSRRFPERHPAHTEVLRRVEIVCTQVINEPVQHTEAFAQAHTGLADWLAAEDANADGAMATEIADLEYIERQALGTLLALETLQDLTARHPAPQSVLRQLETAWVPQMSGLYLAEAGEGPQWRAAGETLKQLFLSLQPPEDETAREACLRNLPRINAELRAGLLAQGAQPEQMKAFFDAITATQECWIRPALGRREDAVSRFVPLRVTQSDIESLAQRQAGMPAADAAERQANALQEGDWVDFDPPYEELATARVAWVGVQGYLLFCDAAGETRFSLDSERLATEVRAGRARIPEQSLTRKAMLRLHARLPDRAA